MVRDKIELNYEEILDWSDNNGFAVIWNPSESELIVDNKIVHIVAEYNVENQTLDQFMYFIGEEDRKNMLSFFLSRFK